MKKLIIEKSGLDIGTVTEEGIDTQNKLLKDAYDLILKVEHTAVEGKMKDGTITDTIVTYRITSKDLTEIGRALFWSGYHVRVE